MDISKLYDIAEENEIDIDYFPMMAATSIATPYGVAIDLDKLNTSADEKACLAHELGHCMTGAFYSVKTLETRGRMEERANRWAIYRLVPIRRLLNAVKSGITEKWEPADYFDVPESFVDVATRFYFSVLNYKTENCGTLR